MATGTTYTLEQIKAAFWEETCEDHDGNIVLRDGTRLSEETEDELKGFAWDCFVETLEELRAPAHVDFTTGHHGQPTPEEVWRSVVERQKERIE